MPSVPKPRKSSKRTAGNRPRNSQSRLVHHYEDARVDSDIVDAGFYTLEKESATTSSTRVGSHPRARERTEYFMMGRNATQSLRPDSNSAQPDAGAAQIQTNEPLSPHFAPGPSTLQQPLLSDHVATNTSNLAHQTTRLLTAPGDAPSPTSESLDNITRAYGDYQRKVLNVLKSRGRTVAMRDVIEYSYPPRCIPGTYEAILTRITSWAKNFEPSRIVLWLSGPAETGKSAIAQTIVGKFRKIGLLGAAFSFSRRNRRDDPEALIPILAYQLAMAHSGYKRIIMQRLVDEPAMLTKGRHAQFKEFIVDPLKTLKTQHPHTVSKPILIVIDGLDECANEVAQQEFVEMITNHARVDQPPLRWLICGRTGSHLSQVFSSEECQLTCQREDLIVNNPDARRDATRLLNDGFAQMRQDYSDRLPNDWPSAELVERIAETSLGHLGFISFILQFIGDENFNDPVGGMDICLKTFDGLRASESLHPLHAGDLLYTQILSTISDADLPVTLSILGLTILYGQEQLTTLILANFLSLDQETFYSSLQRVHSVMEVPPAPEAPRLCLLLYRSSFADYLSDPVRSGRFAIDEGTVHLKVARQGFQWLRHASRTKPGDLPPISTSLDHY
ncbi:hypothetical protein AN958_08110 [Leucoagaricus sp. SymC.cos]|nr:hypothetical protein AN958_08110 [Leucoagaricus sp. SymC.cos]